MKFRKWIKRLQKNKVLARWPPVWFAFLMAVILLGEAWVFPIERLKMPMYYSAIFAFVFAFTHWFVVRNLERKP